MSASETRHRGCRGTSGFALLNPTCSGGVAAFAATGARIIANLGKLLTVHGGRGLISVCTAGGMGVTAIMEGSKAAASTMPVAAE